MQKIRIIGFFFENRLHWQFKVEKNFYKRLFLGYIFIYVQTKQHIIPYMHLTTGNSLSNFETSSAVSVYSMYLRLNLPTTTDLKFQRAVTFYNTVLDLIIRNLKAN
jgi:hypothetical protein